MKPITAAASTGACRPSTYSKYLRASCPSVTSQPSNGSPLTRLRHDPAAGGYSPSSTARGRKAVTTKFGTSTTSLT